MSVSPKDQGMVREKVDKSANIFNAWKSYIDNGLRVDELVNPLIKDSWLRCRQMGLDPYKSKFRIEKADILKAGKESSRVFINIITPYVHGLKANAQGMNILIGLFDCQGNLIYADGDRRVLETARSLGIKEGADLSEKSAGTNAIAVAMRQNAPVVVCGHEHFCQDLHIFGHCSKVM